MIYIDLLHHSIDKQKVAPQNLQEYDELVTSTDSVTTIMGINALNETADKPPEYWFSYGIHPLEIQNIDVAEKIEVLNKYINETACLAVGECGMDTRAETATRQQRLILEQQLSLAVEHNKPALLHCVGHHLEIIEVLKKFPKLKVIMLGFNKNKEWADKFLKLNVYLSFGKDLLRYDHVQQYFKDLPSDCIFIETNNSEVDIKELYAKAASLRNTDVASLTKQVATNFYRLFTVK